MKNSAATCGGSVPRSTPVEVSKDTHDPRIGQFRAAPDADRPYPCGVASACAPPRRACPHPPHAVGVGAATGRKGELRALSRASRWQVFGLLRLPNAMPYMFAGLEIAMIFAVSGAIVAEFVGARSRLGMLIQSMNFTMVVAGQL